jgi:hypothetical protein
MEFSDYFSDAKTKKEPAAKEEVKQTPERRVLDISGESLSFKKPTEDKVDTLASRMKDVLTIDSPKLKEKEEKTEVKG